MKTVCVVLGIFAVAIPNLFAQGVTSVHTDINPNKQVVVLGAPLVVTLNIRSDVESSIDLGANSLANLIVHVTDPTGKTVIRSFPIPDFTTPGKVSLRAGEVHQTRLNLSAAYSPEAVGSYRIQILITNNPSLSIMSQPPVANVVVIEADRGKLATVCNDIGDRMKASLSASDRLELAGELAIVHDPVATPVIQSLLNHGLAIDDVLIRSLGNIGDPSAVDLLQQTAAGPDQVSALVARSALYNVQARTTDPSLRLRATRALEVLGSHL